MNNVLFPTNPQERYNPSSAVRRYTEFFHNNLPEIEKNLIHLRTVLTETALASLRNLPEKMKKIAQWTFTSDQHIRAIEQISRIVSTYPAPSPMGRMPKGGLLDIRKINRADLSKTLDHFAENLPAFSPINLPGELMKNIGNLPLITLHQKNDLSFFDPFLDGKMQALWTLDVSFNPGLSIKDVMARQMLEDAFDKNLIDTSTVVVEATSGNTGVGVGFVAALYGLKTIFIIPDKMSQEKIDRLRYFGSHVIVTPTKVAPEDPRSYYSVRDYLAGKKGFWSSQQYDNLSNRIAHERVTAPLVWEKTQGTVTAVIATAGTCGTVSGIGRFLKKRNPEIKIIAVDTVGSILYLLKQGYDIQEVQSLAHSYDLQGFGEDIHPQNLDTGVIDHFIRVSDASGLQMARLLPALGVFQGQSSGAAYAALLQALESGILTSRDRILIIFPDTAIPYRFDVFNDHWMQAKGFTL